MGTRVVSPLQLNHQQQFKTKKLVSGTKKLIKLWVTMS